MIRLSAIAKLIPAAVLMLAVLGRLAAQDQSDRSPDKKAEANSTAGAEVTDSTSGLPGADSSLILDKKLSAEDYMESREKFSYPHTRREDPFELPFEEQEPGKEAAPTLNEIELTGVLFSPDGRSVAIMSTVAGKGGGEGGAAKAGASFLVRAGDMIGKAKVVMIEAKQIRLRIVEYGIVRNIVKELKPLVEEKDG